KQPKHPNLMVVMGPGLITGASDDDPSGIATYSQAGAQFGVDMGWTLVLTFPLMCAIQQISANIGRVTGRGLSGNIRQHYPAPVLYGLVGLHSPREAPERPVVWLDVLRCGFCNGEPQTAFIRKQPVSQQNRGKLAH